MSPAHRCVVVGQKLDFKDDQHANRGDRQRNPGHSAQQPAEHAFALTRRAGKKLRKQRIRKPLTYPDTIRLVRHIMLDRLIIGVGRARQQHDLKQHEDMIDHEYQRQQDGGCGQRQVDVDRWQLDRLFEKNLAVRDHRSRRGQVGGEHHEAQPYSRHAAGGIVDRALQGADVEGVDSGFCHGSPPCPLRLK